MKRLRMPWRTRAAGGRALLGSSRWRMGAGVTTVVSALLLSLLPATAAATAVLRR